MDCATGTPQAKKMRPLLRDTSSETCGRRGEVVQPADVSVPRRLGCGSNYNWI